MSAAEGFFSLRATTVLRKSEISFWFVAGKSERQRHRLFFTSRESCLSLARVHRLESERAGAREGGEKGSGVFCFRFSLAVVASRVARNEERAGGGEPSRGVLLLFFKQTRSLSVYECRKRTRGLTNRGDGAEREGEGGEQLHGKERERERGLKSLEEEVGEPKRGRERKKVVSGNRRSKGKKKNELSLPLFPTCLLFFFFLLCFFFFPPTSTLLFLPFFLAEADMKYSSAVSSSRRKSRKVGHKGKREL